MRYLERFIDKDLLDWAKCEQHKPLLQRGARQVGKTSAVRHLHTDSNGVPLFAEAKEKYKRYIFMDTGLLQRTLELDLTDILVSNDLKLINRGALAETFVGTELVKNRPPYLNDNLYCWHRVNFWSI